MLVAALVNRQAQRDRARHLATTIVSGAIAIVGLTLVVLSIMLVVRGGWGFAFLALIVFIIGALLSALGFFFQLVPFRLAELQEEKNAYDARVRERQ